MPLESHISVHAANFHRFDVSWTPTILVLDSDGLERFRIEGYLPRREFQSELEMGLARVDFKRKSWESAARRYAAIIDNHRESPQVPEATYWLAVCDYKRSSNHLVLADPAVRLNHEYPDSVWALKASVWLPEEDDDDLGVPETSPQSTCSR